MMSGRRAARIWREENLEPHRSGTFKLSKDPPLAEKIADIVVIAIFRELGPLISAVVLSGFGGASIAAELGAMVEGEEIKALEPIDRVPRMLQAAELTDGLPFSSDDVELIEGAKEAEPV